MKRILSLVLLCAGITFAADDVRTVTILHTNDLHSRLSPLDNGNGGFAYVAAAIRKEREHCTGCLLLNAGDIAQGSPASTIFHGLPAWEVVNLFGYDAGTLGNHDFDYGWMQAKKFVETAKYPVVVSNFVGAKGQLFTPKPYVILKANGVRVAVVGALTEDMVNLSTPVLRGEWHTTALLDTIRKTVAKAKKKADIVVILSHVTPEEEQRLLTLGNDVPVIISGHAHNGMPAPVVKDNRVVARVKAYGEEIGRLELHVNVKRKTVESWTWKAIPVSPRAYAAAPDVEKVVQEWEQKVGKIVDEPIAVSEREFAKPEVRQMLERVMRDATGADFAFMNAGGVRDIIPKGQLLARHAWNVMPFDNRIMIGKFKGSQLPEVVTRGHTIDPEREYTLAVNDFTAANQSAPSQLGTKGLEFPKPGPLMRDALVEWIRKQGTLK